MDAHITVPGKGSVEENGMSKFTEHIGGRIRLYRKNKHMTIDELAAKIHKSKATVSKYERGDISIDIETLCRIAAVLNVSISQLTDMKPASPVTPATTPRSIFKNTALYLYYYDGRLKKLVRGYLQIYHESQTDENRAVLYLDVNSFSNYTKCRILYSGQVFIHDSVVNFQLSNQANGIERMNITALNPIINKEVVTALLSGISDNPFMPVSFKCLFSSYPLSEDADLISRLTISRDDIKMMKKYNSFTCDQFPG